MMKSKKILHTRIVTLIFLLSHNSQTYVNNDRLCRGTWGDNEWYNEWQQMITSDKTSDSKWKRMSGNKWQRVIKWVKTNDREWKQVK